MYKVHLARRVTEQERRDVGNPCESLLEVLLPELERRLAADAGPERPAATLREEGVPMKNTPDRFDGPLPVRPPQSAPVAAARRARRRLRRRAPAAGRQAGLAPARLARLPPPLVAGRPALGAGSAALMALAYYKVKPTYDAIAAIRVEPGEQAIYAQSTQPDRLRRVHGDPGRLDHQPDRPRLALTEHPELYQLPTLQHAEDPEAEIRQRARASRSSPRPT